MEATAIGRSIIKSSPGKLEIIIPAKKNWLNLGVLAAVLVFWWFTGGYIAVSGLIDHQHIEVYDWVWFGLGVAIILILLRNLWLMLVVKELIVFEENKLIIKKLNHPFVPNKIFKRDKVRQLGLAEQGIEEDRNSFWSREEAVYIGAGMISFEYGKKVIRFGEGLDFGETERLLEKITDAKLG